MHRSTKIHSRRYMLDTLIHYNRLDSLSSRIERKALVDKYKMMSSKYNHWFLDNYSESVCLEQYVVSNSLNYW